MDIISYLKSKNKFISKNVIDSEKLSIIVTEYAVFDTLEDFLIEELNLCYSWLETPNDSTWIMSFDSLSNKNLAQLDELFDKIEVN